MIALAVDVERKSEKQSVNNRISKNADSLQRPPVILSHGVPVEPQYLISIPATVENIKSFFRECIGSHKMHVQLNLVWILLVVLIILSIGVSLLFGQFIRAGKKRQVTDKEETDVFKKVEGDPSAEDIDLRDNRD